MDKKKTIENKIKKLNLAWNLVQRALKIIKNEFSTNSNKTVDFFIWKFEKTNNKLLQHIYSAMENNFVEEEHQALIKRLRKPKENNNE